MGIKKLFATLHRSCSQKRRGQGEYSGTFKGLQK